MYFFFVSAHDTLTLVTTMSVLITRYVVVGLTRREAQQRSEGKKGIGRDWWSGLSQQIDLFSEGLQGTPGCHYQRF